MNYPLKSIKIIFILLLIVTQFSGSVLASEYASEIFYKIRTESNSSSESIGSYSKGCLSGGMYLPSHAEYYDVLRPSRNRFWGHPDLIEFIELTSEQIFNKFGNGLLIGDLSMPRGGPMPYGHKSHQNGLDVDIYYEKKPDFQMDRFKLETYNPKSLLSPNQREINYKLWTEYQYDLLKITSKNDRVARVFVNPLIKNEICKIAIKKGDTDWLNKIRPWGGHYKHFHVRLTCPEGSNDCINQAPIKQSDGCGNEIQSWLQKDKVFESNSTKIKKWMLLSELPNSCKNIIRD